MYLKNINKKKLFNELFTMLFGMFITSIAVYFFLKPSGLIIGSISGLALVIERLTNIPISISTFVINGFLLVLANIFIGKEFGIKTIFTSLILSPYLAFFEKFFPIEKSIMQDPWLDLLCFVLLLGFAQAFLFRINASTGGLDILAKFINKYLKVEMGTSITIGGSLICMTAFLVNDVRLVIIGLIGTYINGLVVNNFTLGFNSKKKVCVISSHYEEIKDFIMDELGRGVTLYKTLGGYKQDEHIEVVTILEPSELAKFMSYLDSNDFDSFISVSTCSEVHGYWQDKKTIRNAHKRRQ